MLYSIAQVAKTDAVALHVSFSQITCLFTASQNI